MSRKSQKIAAAISHLQGRDLDAHYLAYFELFNQQLFYEAHDVLEELWLSQRKQPDGLFYQALIQLAGAFVHLQKDRLQPAAALFKLAQTNLQNYPAIHQGLELQTVRSMIEKWLSELESGGFTANPIRSATAPVLALIDSVR